MQLLQVAVASAQETAQLVTSESSVPSTNQPSTEVVGDIQEAIGGDMDLKMMIVEDGSPEGKCYCSCNLNNQPVFMEINSADLDSYAVV